MNSSTYFFPSVMHVSTCIEILHRINIRARGDVIIFFYMIIRCREKSFVFIIGMIMITAQIIAAILSEVVSTTSLESSEIFYISIQKAVSAVYGLKEILFIAVMTYIIARDWYPSEKVLKDTP